MSVPDARPVAQDEQDTREMSGTAPPELTEEIRGLREEVARLNSLSFVRIHNSIPRLLGYSLARGAAFGLGTVLGASLLLSALAWSLSQVEFVPIVGEWIGEIAKQIEDAATREPAMPAN